MIPAEARCGTTVGKYRLHEIVGRGGMGVVYRGEHVYIGREVAVKILHEGFGTRDEAVKRFLREARAASLINHPNIVDVTDFGKASDGTVFFVMELLVGEPLDAILTRDHRLELLRAITICNQMAAALGAAHAKDIIHRDLKPENVMLIPREGRRELIRQVLDETGHHEVSERETRFDLVKILDFGVAKVREPEAERVRTTQAGVVFGTPEYMAPETARVGTADARSDIYALGIMFYEMLTGSVPFTGEAPVDVMIKQVNEPVPPPRDVAPDAEITDEAERLILKALSKDPDLRQQTMEEFHRDLQRCYGQVRFRRIVSVPLPQTPPATMRPPIPLTRKKASQRPTPALGTSAAGRAPILLTKKKPPRPDRRPQGDAAAWERTPTPTTAPRTPIGKPKRKTLPLGIAESSPPTPLAKNVATNVVTPVAKKVANSDERS